MMTRRERLVWQSVTLCNELQALHRAAARVYGRDSIAAMRVAAIARRAGARWGNVSRTDGKRTRLPFLRYRRDGSIIPPDLHNGPYADGSHLPRNASQTR